MSNHGRSSRPGRQVDRMREDPIPDAVGGEGSSYAKFDEKVSGATRLDHGTRDQVVRGRSSDPTETESRFGC